MPSRALATMHEHTRTPQTEKKPLDWQPLDMALASLEGPGSLVAIAREGRLARRRPGMGSVRVQLGPVDEAALALVGLALDQRRSITVVYPAPAGEVSVLLAAEILIRRLLTSQSSQRVGIVVADTSRATSAWDELAISAPGSRTPIRDVFPVLRAGPDGESPIAMRQFRGGVIGRHFHDWPVDVVIVDHLSGPVLGDPI